jgi:energy-coupling factor transporter ATP-binding protein EcfA2
MRIRLNPFKQHEDRTFEFPDEGMILLQGPSGIGKSTVLDAIHEAMYGEADDAQPWGSNYSCVELWLNRPEPMYIKRERGPRTIVVEYQGKEYKDEAAQAIINEVHGEEHEFLASRYIRQAMAGSLLSLGAADQLRFIQKLSAGAQDPESLREDIQAKVTERDRELDEADRGFNSAKLSLDLAETALLEIVLDEPKAPMPLDELRKKADEYAKAQDDMRALNAEIAKNEKSLTNPVYALISQIEEREAASIAIKKNNEEQADAFQLDRKELEVAGSPGISGAECKSRETILQNTKKYLETIDEIKKIGQEVIARCKTEPDAKPSDALAIREAALKALRETLEREDKEIIQKLDDWSNAENPQPCPVCATLLRVESGKILVSDSPLRATIDHIALHARRKEIGETQKNIDGELKWGHGVKVRVEAYKSSLPTEIDNSLKTLAEVTNAIEAVREANRKHNEWDQKVKSLSLREKALRTANLQLDKSLEADRQAIAQALANGLEPRETVEATRKALNERHWDLIGNVSALAPFGTMYSDYLKASQAYAVTKARFDERHGVYQSRLQEAAKAGLVREVASLRLAAAKRLKERSDEAAVLSIELVIDQINEKAKAYIDRMFPNDGTIIKIKNLTQIKSGDTRPKLSIEIYHKGKVAKKVSGISGGERSRAYLCFQMALGDIYKSPILLVDEGFAGLDMETKKECLEVLKDAAGDRLIIVIEHGAPESMFDQVITVG